MSQQLTTSSEGSTVDTPPLRRDPDWRTRIVGGVAIVLVLFVVQDILRKPAFNWPVVWEYIFNPAVMQGLRLTVSLTVLSMIIGLALSVGVAQMRMSQNKVLSYSAAVFVWFFRALPLLVLLIIVYNIGLLYPEIGFGVPFGGFKIFEFEIQQLITPFIAAVFAFSLHECAYGSEIVRASLMSVPKGQIEAAESLGMSRGKIMRRIVIPQAMKVAIPPLANNVITMVKGTALVAFIAVPDLLYSVQRIYLSNYQVMPLLTVATIWYLVLVTILSFIQQRLEIKFGPGTMPTQKVKKKALKEEAR